MCQVSDDVTSEWAGQRTHLPFTAVRQTGGVGDGVAPHGGVSDGCRVRHLEHDSAVDGLDTATRTHAEKRTHAVAQRRQLEGLAAERSPH